MRQPRLCASGCGFDSHPAFNTRVVKFILKADIEHFVSFITYQSRIFNETLFSLAILNNYHQNKKYKTNFEILKNLL